MTDVLQETEVVANPPTLVNDKLTAERIAEVQEVFSFFDKDADGCVTIENLGPLVRSIGYNPSESDLRFLTATLKSEGKESLEFVDFLAIIPSIQRSGETEAELIEAFQVFDKDGTGHIGAVELRHVITNLGEKLSEDEADELIRFADETSQGEISYKELVQLLIG